MHPTSDLTYTSRSEPQTVLDALRSMLSQHPQAATAGPETFAELLYDGALFGTDPRSSTSTWR